MSISTSNKIGIISVLLMRNYFLLINFIIVICIITVTGIIFISRPCITDSENPPGRTGVSRMPAPSRGKSNLTH